MFVIKYKLDSINSYVIERELRTNNPKLAMKFKDKSKAKRVAMQFEYDLNEVDIIEVE